MNEKIEKKTDSNWTDDTKQLGMPHEKKMYSKVINLMLMSEWMNEWMDGKDEWMNEWEEQMAS